MKKVKLTATLNVTDEYYENELLEFKDEKTRKKQEEELEQDEEGVISVRYTFEDIEDEQV